MSSQDKFAPQYQKRQVIIFAEGKAHSLDTYDSMYTQAKAIRRLHSNEEKTDTRAVLYCKYAQSYETVRVRSPDSDVFFILSHLIHVVMYAIYFDTRTTWEQQTPDRLGVWILSGIMHCTHGAHYDSISTFKGIWKIKSIKKKTMQINQILQPVFVRPGEKWEVANDILAGFEAFTYMYLKMA